MLQVQVIRADLDEILFENREKRYGGYVLRKNYEQYLAFGLLIMLTLTTLGVAGPFIYAKIHAMIGVDAKKVVEIEVIKMPMEKSKEKKPEEILPLPPKVEVQAAPLQVEEIAVKVAVPKPPEQVQEEEVVHTTAEIATAKASTEDVAGDKPENLNAPKLTNAEPRSTGDVPQTIQEPPVKPTKTETEAPATTTKEPLPTDFISAKQPKEVNLTDIQKLIGYPEVAKQMGEQGTIVLRVLLDENGNYVRHLSPKNGHPILIRAVEEHISKVKFTPAIQGNKAIKFWVNVPFVFKLQ